MSALVGLIMMITVSAAAIHAGCADAPDAPADAPAPAEQQAAPWPR